MKVTRCALAALFGCAIIAGPVLGQTLRHPASVRPAALSNDNFDYYGYYGDQEEPSPSDKPAADEPAPVREPALDMTGGACGSCGACDSCCDSGCGTCFLFGPDEPFTLFPNNNSVGLKAGFWTQFGYHTEGTNGIRHRLDEQLSEPPPIASAVVLPREGRRHRRLRLRLGIPRRLRVRNRCSGHPSVRRSSRHVGFRLGYNGGAYGHAIPQAYAEVGFNNLTAKIGHFYTIMGYEVVPATGNFFYSHAFEFYISEPFTHTGALLDYKLAEDVTVLGGWTAGWDTGFSRNGGSTFIGGLKLQIDRPPGRFLHDVMGRCRLR